MAKRYSKRVREEAALICAIAASGTACFPIYDEIAKNESCHPDALFIARKTWNYVMKEQPEAYWSRIVDAEAEALIRTGWSP